MISTWSLQNFKSVYKEPSLRMAPLTIFAGANSSGKSTVIQSILLTAQTLQSAVVARPIVLNGHIVRLGAYDDIVSDGEKNSHIQIGFSLSPDSDNYVSLLQASSRSNYYRLSPSNTRYIRSLTCKFAFSAAGGDEDQKSLQLQPRIENCSVEITAQRQVRIPTTSGVQATLQDQSFDIEVVRSNKNYEDRLRDLGLDMTVEEDALTEALAYEVPKCTRLPFIRRSVGATPSQKPSGALLNHFLPGRLCVSYDSVGEQIKRMVEFIVSSPVFRSVDFDADDQWLFNDKVKTLFIGAVQELLHTIRPKLSLTRCKRVDKAVASVTQTFSPETVRHFTASLLDDHKRLFSHIMAEKSADIQKILKSERPPLHTVAYVPLPELGEMGVSYIQAFFTQRVKYLGPLRDEPKPVYPLAGASDSRDVGFKGEYTAAVLEVHWNTFVTYIPSSEFAGGAASHRPVSVPLGQAVLDWLGYMGVVSNIQTEDKGKLGHELKVATLENDNLHDLTHVGVGVSQILPILVLCLLAEPGSTLIFEQPELHLHPRVQTRLADFFISMTLIKNQCIVETHSEYMINRLRYQVAVSEGSNLSDNIVLYFVEKHEGRSSYRSIKINQYGVIEDWPKGFFDENEENAAAMLRAAMEKRRKSAQNA